VQDRSVVLLSWRDWWTTTVCEDVDFPDVNGITDPNEWEVEVDACWTIGASMETMIDWVMLVQ